MISAGQGARLWYTATRAVGRPGHPPFRTKSCRKSLIGRAAAHIPPFHAILIEGRLRGCASHVRTDRPHPAPNGAGLARVALCPPVASLQTRALTAHGPVRGAFVLPATHDGGVASRHHPRRRPGNPSGAFLPLETLTKAHRPWNQTRGYRAPRPTRRRLSRPGTHEQAAFEPLHPDEGYSPPRPRAGHAVPAPQPGFVPVTTTERPLSRSQAAPPPQHRSHVKPGGIHGG